MFAIPPLIVLVGALLLLPDEPLVSVGAACLAALGATIDLRLRHTRPAAAPSLPWVLALASWVLLGIFVKQRAALATAGPGLALSLAAYGLVAHGAQTLRAFERVAAALLAITLALAALAVHQSRAGFGCHRVDDARPGASVGVYDGRPCAVVEECRGDAGAHYLCERVGLFGTHSVGGGRVRYAGPLADPSALALALGMGPPLAFAFASAERRRRTVWRALLLAIAVVGIGLAVVATRSRSGQLVFAIATGVYVVRRFGVGGVLLGATLAAAMVLAGGRSGEAYAPSYERLESWWVGLSLAGEAPLLGVGAGQFVDHHALAAKSAVVQAAAEAGLPGLFLLSMVLWVTAKTPIALLRSSPLPPPPALRAWAVALLASLGALVVGMLFSAVAWDPTVWIVVGLGGALHQVARRADPNFRLAIGARDLAGVLVVDGALVAAIALYTRSRT